MAVTVEVDSVVAVVVEREEVGVAKSAPGPAHLCHQNPHPRHPLLDHRAFPGRRIRTHRACRRCPRTEPLQEQDWVQALDLVVVVVVVVATV